MITRNSFCFLVRLKRLLPEIKMSELFKNKYRIASARLQKWNYANEGMYFVTICTKNRENYFGNIDSKGIFKPTEIGEIAYSEWFNAINIRPDMNLILGEFVVMPNHIHGIIIIGENDYNAGLSGSLAINGRGAMHCASTIDNENDNKTHSEYKNQFAPQSKNLSSIIRGYKSSVTTFARKNGIDFGWQPLFYDHIIRSQNDFDRISNYIIQNPYNWAKDKFHLGKQKIIIRLL